MTGWVRRFLLGLCATLPFGVAAMPLCDSTEQRQAFYKALEPWQKSLEQKRFAEADKHFNALIADTAAGKMNDQELHRWFEVFYKWNPGREPLHEDWIRQFPNSAAAYLAAAYHYEARGWNSRGGEYSSKTSDSQFQAMGQEFRKAFENLTRAEGLMARPTLAAAMRMWMMAAAGDRRNQVRDIYRSAIKSFPETVQVRVIWVTLSHPKWGGSIDQLKDVVGDARSLNANDRRYIEYLVNEELGHAYRDADEPKRAAEYYGKAIPMCPGLDGALTADLKMHQAQKNYEAIIPLATTYIERYPRGNWGWAMRGWAHVERKEYDRAAYDYERGALYGSSYAQEGLAWLTEWGHGGVKQDYGKAIELYEIAAANGSPTAAQKAEKIRKGIGVKRATAGK